MDIPLRLLGWNPITEEVHERMEDHKKLIMVYPHTSHYDFTMYMLYMFSDSVLRTRSKVLVNPRFMKMPLLGSFIKSMGGITSTPRQKKNGGNVKVIVDALKDMEEFVFIISPKGSIDPHDWRSGYYHIAQETGAEIVAAGFDFKKREFVYKEPFSVEGMTIEEVEAKAKYDLRDIYPCHPRYTEYPATFNRDDPSMNVTDTWRLIIFILVVLILLLLFVSIIGCISYYLYIECRRRNIRMPDWIPIKST